MDSVNIERKKLIEIVKKNLETHRSEYTEASKGYKEQLMECLLDTLDAVREDRAFSLHFALPEPVDYTKQYESALRMLELSVDDTIVLTRNAFQQYVMDDWHWKEVFNSTKAFYSVTR